MYKLLGLITLCGGILTTGVAWAIPSEVNLSLKRQETESYEQFMQRAQTLTSNTIQQRFKNNQLEEVRVVVIGENKGAISQRSASRRAPILTVEVNRNNSNTDPSVKRWQNDFPFSRELLGFEQPQAQMEPSVPIEVPTSEPETPEPSDTPETTDTPEKKPPTPSPAELVPLPYPDQVPSTDTPQIPLPNQRLQPNRMKQP